jgi:hypothetical protein
MITATAVDLGGGRWLPVLRDGEYACWHGPRTYSTQVWAEKIARGALTRRERVAEAIEREIYLDSDYPAHQWT